MTTDVKITVGLMVYNEARNLEKTIHNILDQSYGDFELLIGDNASTDGSSELIQNFMRNDPRIVLIKRETNIGALQNWNDLIANATGKYFVLAGGHDLWSRNYLSALHDALEKHHDAALAFTKSQWIDGQGNELDIPTPVVSTRGVSRMGGFAVLMYAGQHYLYGMMRSDAVRKTRKQLEIIGSGEIFLQELAQLGDFIFVENEVWYRRKNRKDESPFDRLRRYQAILFSSERNRKKFKIFPHMQMMMAYLALPFKLQNLTLMERFSFCLVYPIILYRFSRSFLLDVKWFFEK